MPWEPYDKLSQTDKDKYVKDAERINKAWGESKEKELPMLLDLKKINQK